MKTHKISFGLITVDYKVHQGMVASFLRMLPRDFSRFEFEPIFEQGIYLEELRNRVAMQFVDSDSDFLIFLDYDNGLPENWLDLFMEDFKNPEVHIVSGAYEFKNNTSDYVAGFQPPTCPHGTYLWVNRQAFTESLINLSRAAGGKHGMVGAGCLMIRKEALKIMPYPWFRQRWEIVDKGVMFWGEDSGFCLNAEKAGLDIYLDQRIKSVHMAGDRCYPEELRQYPKSEISGQGDPFSAEIHYQVLEDLCRIT